MGKKSREKKERRERRDRGLEEAPAREKTWVERFLLEIVRFGTYCALFTPLVLSVKFYFPFVGPKSLYFMGGCQIVFFAWLILAIYYKQYRPRINAIFLALVLFLIVLILSSILGIDFSRSFWSKYERMTGLLMWLHVFAFFLAVSSSFKKESDWKKIFIVSVFVSILVAAASLLEYGGVARLQFSPRGGTTLGNTSFLGTYLVFNTFLALYLFLRSLEFKKGALGNWGLRAYALIAVFLAVPAMYFNGARAAYISTFGGFTLLALLWLGFKSKHKINRIVGRILLVVSFIAVLAVFVLLFQPESFVHQKFITLVSRARFVNWDMAWKGFLERKLLGWGPENYTLTFTKFFNPCLFTTECGEEIWFDRSHSIVFDTLVTTGIFGFVSYLGLFGSLFYILGKKYFKEKSLDFWTFAIFVTIPITYFIQNLTVFDMVASLMMFVLILGFGGFLASLGREKKIEKRFALKHKWLPLVLFLIFCFTFFEFVIQPFRTDALVIKALRTQDPTKRVEAYKKTLDTSPLGKYQVREFFAQHSHDLIQNVIVQEGIEGVPRKEDAKKELEFVAEKMEETIEESPLDFRSTLKLAQLYNVYGMLDPQKLPLAEKYGKKAIELSPTNQQAYWALAQTKVRQRDAEAALPFAQKAIELEPKWLQSHSIAVHIARLSGDKEKAQELAQEAYVVALEEIELNPRSWPTYQMAIQISEMAESTQQVKELAQIALVVALEDIELHPEILQNYQRAIEFAGKAGDAQQVKEIVKRAVEFNPDWEEVFKDILKEETIDPVRNFTSDKNAT